MSEQQNGYIWYTPTVCVTQTHTCVCVHLYADFEYSVPRQVFALMGLGDILRGQSCVKLLAGPSWSQLACWAQTRSHFAIELPAGTSWSQIASGIQFGIKLPAGPK